MKFEIKHRYSGEILFSIETDSLRLALEAAVKSKADLHGANLHWANLHGADLHGADLREADLRWADLREADLHGADLRGADLRWADLRWADLRWADLREADLRWADLRGADLRWADLREADLFEADLRWADLRGANLLTFQYQRHMAICTGERLIIGCIDKSLLEWSAEFESIGKQNEYSDLQIKMYGQFIAMCIEHAATIKESEG